MDLAFIIRLSWAWRPEIILTLGLAATVHLTGRWRLKRKGSEGLTKPWRSISYLSGLAILWIALMSPIDVLSDQFFYMHMIQHLLLVMIAPPLLLIANPMPIMLWGLPSSLRLEIGRGRLIAVTQGRGAWSAPVFPPIPGDLDGDGDVDLADLAELLSSYGCTGGGCVGDLDGDGDTDLSDLAQLLASYGS